MTVQALVDQIFASVKANSTIGDAVQTVSIIEGGKGTFSATTGTRPKVGVVLGNAVVVFESDKPSEREFSAYVAREGDQLVLVNTNLTLRNGMILRTATKDYTVRLVKDILERGTLWRVVVQ